MSQLLLGTQSLELERFPRKKIPIPYRHGKRQMNICYKTLT